MKKNLLLIMADQFAYHALGCLGSCAQTPALDGIAKTAYQFSHCYSNSPLCLPSRASLATGRYPEELNTMDNYSAGLGPDSITWMQRIRDEGYSTSVFGKVHLHKFSPDLRDFAWKIRQYGFDVVDELPGPRTYGIMRSSYYDHLQRQGLLECYREDMKRRYEEGPVYESRPTPLPTKDYADVYIADKAIEYLETVEEDKPWFSMVSFGGPHDPWDTPAEYTQLYQDIVPPPPLSAPISLNPDRPKGVYDEILSGKYDSSLTEEILHMTAGDITALRRSYYGHVTLIDRQIGRILECLERKGMLQNTVIAFTSDHGEENGDYGLLFKETFFESSVRVPLFISVPGQMGRQIDSPVELMDLGPTLCGILGMNISLGHACSMMPLMQNRGYGKKMVVSQIFGETMVLKDSVKAVFNREGMPYLLFDMKNDPEEKNNLAATKEVSDLEREMTEALRTWKIEIMNHEKKRSAGENESEREKRA